MEYWKKETAASITGPWMSIPAGWRTGRKDKNSIAPYAHSLRARWNRLVSVGLLMGVLGGVCGNYVGIMVAYLIRFIIGA